MKHVTETLSVPTRQRCEMIDITERVEEIARAVEHLCPVMKFHRAMLKLTTPVFMCVSSLKMKPIAIS